jgi:hypothetical protein
VNYSYKSARSWRDIARDLAHDPTRSKRRVLMQELGDSFDPRFATCAICNSACKLTTCKIDESGRPVHEHCYTRRLKATHRNGSS